MAWPNCSRELQCCEGLVAVLIGLLVSQYRDTTFKQGNAPACAATVAAKKPAEKSISVPGIIGTWAACPRLDD